MAAPHDKKIQRKTRTMGWCSCLLVFSICTIGKKWFVDGGVSAFVLPSLLHGKNNHNNRLVAKSGSRRRRQRMSPAFQPQPRSADSQNAVVSNSCGGLLRKMSFYDDFADQDNDDEDEDDDDEDDEDDEMTEEDRRRIESFRKQMMKGSFSDDEDEDEDEDEDDYDEYEYEDDDDDDEDLIGGEAYSSLEDLVRSRSAEDASSAMGFGTTSSTSGGSSDAEEKDWAEPVFDLPSTESSTSNDSSSSLSKKSFFPFSLSSSSSSSSSSETSLDISSEEMDQGLQGGVILLANPAFFCSDYPTPTSSSSSSSSSSSNSLGDFFGGGSNTDQSPSPALLSKFGLTLPPPAELGPDRRADLLPVLLLLDRHPLKGSQAVLLNRRTGYLIGDLEQQQQQQFPQPSEDNASASASADASASKTPPPRLGAFMIQPLWFGGTSGSNTPTSSSSSSAKSQQQQQQQRGGFTATGLHMLHQCPYLPNAQQLTPDGLYFGGDPVQAQSLMNDPRLAKPLTGFEFKFFVQSTVWLPLQLEREVKRGVWFVARVEKGVLFKSRDRSGSRRAKPLWTEVMELLGGGFKGVRDELYGE